MSHENPKRFADLGYCILKDAFNAIDHYCTLEMIVQRMRESFQKTREHDTQVSTALSLRYEVESEKLLVNLLPLMEQQTGLKLFPTYAYTRLYSEGDRLERHKDRPACQISATICLSRIGETSWPIWVADAYGAEVPVSQERGDMLIYKGTEREHWRDTAPQGLVEQIQVFCHYVDQNGPFSDLVFDRIRAQRGKLSLLRFPGRRAERGGPAFSTRMQPS